MSGSKISGSTRIDPVCGMEVTPQSPFRATYKGGDYVFCSHHCLAVFQKNPGKFIAAPAEVFRCPRHPWVLQAEPGTCPECGEFLVEVRTKWTCPYHPRVLYDEPGVCPIYGMPLVPDPPGRFYICDVHPEVRQLEPGKCPRCDMILRPAWAEVCHLHCEELNSTTRSCPSCGKELGPRKVPKERANEYERVWVCSECVLVFTHD